MSYYSFVVRNTLQGLNHVDIVERGTMRLKTTGR